MRSKNLRATVLLSLTFMIAGCGTSAASTTPAPITAAPSNGSQNPSAAVSSLPPLAPTSITYWLEEFTAREALDNQFIADFEAKNPGVTVKVETGPADDTAWLTKVVTALAGGNGPDCFNIWNQQTGNLLGSGSLAPVDPAANGASSQSQLEARYLPGTLEGFKYQGKLYAVPTEVSIYDLFMNTAMMKAAGLDSAVDAPKTWDDLVGLAKKIDVGSGPSLTRRAFDFYYGAPDDPSPALIIAGMAYQLGGTLLSQDQSKATVNTAAWVKVYSFIRDWVKNGYGSPALTSAFDGFTDGSVGMIMSGSWEAGFLSDSKSSVAQTYAVAPFPRFADAVNNTGAFAYGYGTYINAKSAPEKQAACQRLVAELASHPKDYLTKTGLLQPTNDLVNDPIVKTVPYLSVFISDLKGTPYWPTLPNGYEMMDVLVRALQRVTSQGQDVQAALNQANGELDQLLSTH
jgi:ABC-type glycerol-3-phosphate transport system substrate-binding protein